MIESKKAIPILILKVLEEYSDAEHYLTQTQIIDYLANDYQVDVERKSVSSYLNILEEVGYDIVKGVHGGVALISRIFDPSETKFIIDAIFSSKSISGKQAKSLCYRLSKTQSRYSRKNYDYVVKTTDINRTNNKEVFYNIEVINEAIRRNKWIGFKYLTHNDEGEQVERFDGYVYHASPCYLVNNFGRYYLLAYRPKHNSVITWKVDNMKDVEVMEEREMVDPRSLEEFKNYGSISDYLNDHIYLFGGKTIEAVVELYEGKSLSYITDWFGKSITVYKVDDKLRVKIRCNETAFYYWVMQYGEHLKIISPSSMIERIKNTANKILETYK